MKRPLYDVLHLPTLVCYTEVVFEDCALPGGIHQRLLPLAILGMCFYCITYPLILFGLLYRNRFRIMEDQLLRAEGLGATRLENPNCYQLRKMFHK